MILVHLMGGLGNQMFQYAAGKALSTRLNLPLKVHFEDHYQHAKRNFALEVFNIKSTFPTPDELNTYLPDRGIKRKLKQLFKLPYQGKLYREPEIFVLDQGFFEIASGVYLSGFWQHTGYFDPIETALRDDFTFKNPAKGENLRVLEAIQSKPLTCSIHIRRTDYTNPASGLYPLPISYYQESVKTLEDTIHQKPNYYIFSDDADWVQDNFTAVPRARMSIVAHNDGAHAHEDMRLMATCDHHIIANSSFSWWGAWLNADNDKKLIAPFSWDNSLNSKKSGLFSSNDILL
ncbi:MAG: alpha-1,2-fucosyltransferase [Cyclobacteriaceae bacterium]